MQKPIITNIPKYTYGLSAQYYLPIGPSYGDVRGSLNWNWQDDMFIAANEDPLSTRASYGLLGLNVAWQRVLGRRVDLSFFMSNVTDKDYAVGALPFTDTLGTATLTFGPPRMWGLRFEYHFGADAN